MIQIERTFVYWLRHTCTGVFSTIADEEDPVIRQHMAHDVSGYPILTVETLCMHTGIFTYLNRVYTGCVLYEWCVLQYVLLVQYSCSVRSIRSNPTHILSLLPSPYCRQRNTSKERKS